MQLRAATKQTNPNFVRVIRQKFQSIRDWEAVVTNHSIGTCSSDLYIDYFFETSGTASCGTTGIYSNLKKNIPRNLKEPCTPILEDLNPFLAF